MHTWKRDWREVVPKEKQSVSAATVAVLDILNELVRISEFSGDWELEIFAWLEGSRECGLITYREEKALCKELKIRVPAWE